MTRLAAWGAGERLAGGAAAKLAGDGEPAADGGGAGRRAAVGDPLRVGEMGERDSEEAGPGMGPAPPRPAERPADKRFVPRLNLPQSDCDAIQSYCSRRAKSQVLAGN